MTVWGPESYDSGPHMFLGSGPTVSGFGTRMILDLVSA